MERNGVFLYEKPLETHTAQRRAILLKAMSLKPCSESLKHTHNRVFSSDDAAYSPFSQDRPQLRWSSNIADNVNYGCFQGGSCHCRPIRRVRVLRRGFKTRLQSHCFVDQGLPEAMKTRVPISCGLLEYRRKPVKATPFWTQSSDRRGC
jgi:hypothetical protein